MWVNPTATLHLGPETEGLATMFEVWDTESCRVVGHIVKSDTGRYSYRVPHGCGEGSYETAGDALAAMQKKSDEQ